MGKYAAYGVVIGYKPGVYEDWNMAAVQVRGVKDAVYNGYATLEEAFACYKEAQRDGDVLKVKKNCPRTSDSGVTSENDGLVPFIPKPGSPNIVWAQANGGIIARGRSGTDTASAANTARPVPAPTQDSPSRNTRSSIASRTRNALSPNAPRPLTPPPSRASRTPQSRRTRGAPTEVEEIAISLSCINVNRSPQPTVRPDYESECRHPRNLNSPSTRHHRDRSVSPNQDYDDTETEDYRTPRINFDVVRDIWSPPPMRSSASGRSNRTGHRTHASVANGSTEFDDTSSSPPTGISQHEDGFSPLVHRRAKVKREVDDRQAETIAETSRSSRGSHGGGVSESGTSGTRPRPGSGTRHVQSSASSPAISSSGRAQASGHAGGAQGGSTQPTSPRVAKSRSSPSTTAPMQFQACRFCYQSMSNPRLHVDCRNRMASAPPSLESSTPRGGSPNVDIRRSVLGLSQSVHLPGVVYPTEQDPRSPVRRSATFPANSPSFSRPSPLMPLDGLASSLVHL